jgi:hypothetical protein
VSIAWASSVEPKPGRSSNCDRASLFFTAAMDWHAARFRLRESRIIETGATVGHILPFLASGVNPSYLIYMKG